MWLVSYVIYDFDELKRQPVIYSVSDPFHIDPDPRLRFVETRIRIRTKIEEISIFMLNFFSFDYPKNYCHVI